MMTIAIMKYDLSDPEDVTEFKRAHKALDAIAALWDIQNNLHYKYKYTELSEEQRTLLDEIESKILDIICEHKIDFNELYS